MKFRIQPALFAAFALFSSFLATSSFAADSRVVTQDQFRDLVRVFRNVVDRVNRLEQRVDQLEARGGAARSGGGAESVDLGALGTSSYDAKPRSYGSGAQPVFKTYFDFYFYAQPVNDGTKGDLTFDNWHSYIFLELSPTPDIQFITNFKPIHTVGANADFYELDYQISKLVQIRIGKIWIPFDDLSYMNPMNVFGGRVAARPLLLSNQALFMPNIWTDLGIALKFSFVDTRPFQFDTHFYVVNGYGQGTDATIRGTTTGALAYPDFENLSIQRDNNRDKAVGGRFAFKFWQKFGVGLSFYTGRWNSQTEDVDRRLTMLGIDSQWRIGNFELRTGYANASFALSDSTTVSRGGLYGELGWKFGGYRKNWKLVGRAGAYQVDDRFRDNPSDVTAAGLTLLWRPSLIQYSFEMSRDLTRQPGKLNQSFTALRAVMAF